MKISWKSKKLWIFIAIFILVIIIFSSVSSTASQKDEEIADLQMELENKQKEIEELGTEIAQLEEKVEEAEPWFEMTEKEQQRKIEEEKEKEEAEKAAAEKKAAEEAAKKEEEEAEAKRKAEEEAKKGYETGITYEQLARTPDDYIGEKVKFRGKVVQLIEGDGTIQIRFAVDDNYDNIILGEYDPSIVDSRVLEDDMITIMGVSGGLITYESTIGGNITIPSLLIDKIDQ